MSALSVLAVCLGFVWYIQLNRWPCGHFESASGCVSSVKLQVDALKLERDSIKIDHRSLDLSSGAEFVVVGLSGVRTEQDTKEQTRKYRSAMVALFNVDDGSLIRIIHEFKGDDYALTEGVALSYDGSLVASYGQEGNKISLIVRRTADGSEVTSIFKRYGKEVTSIIKGYLFACIGMLDFSQDNQALQCGDILFPLNSTQHRSLSHKGEFVYPMIADSSSSNRAIAPDGTQVEENFDWVEKKVKLTVSGATSKLVDSPFDLVDAKRNLMFSPNSKFFIEGYRVHNQIRGKRRFKLPLFRRLSAIAIWTHDGKLKRKFFTNKRYSQVAWSRDSKYYTLIHQDLTLQVFQNF